MGFEVFLNILLCNVKIKADKITGHIDLRGKILFRAANISSPKLSENSPADNCGFNIAIGSLRKPIFATRNFRNKY